MDSNDINAQLIGLMETMGDGVFKAAPVTEQPDVTLFRWKIMESSDGKRYFAGDEGFGQGRASTEIVSYDETTQRGKTRSGRLYELKGEPAGNLSSDAAYVWDYYSRLNKITVVN